MPPRRTWPNWSTSPDWQLHRPLLGGGPLGDDDDRGEVALGVAALEGVAHGVDVEGLLGDEDHGGPTGDARPRGDVPGVAAHDLDDHHPVVRLGGGVEPVDGVDGDLHGGVEAEGELGAREVVVDGLGHADDRHAELVQLVGHPQRVLAADGDEGVDAEPFEAGPAGVDPSVDGERVGPRRAQDGAAAWERATQRLHVEGAHRPVDDARASRRGSRPSRRRRCARPCGRPPASRRSGRGSHRRRSASPRASNTSPPLAGSSRHPTQAVRRARRRAA